MVSLLRRRAYLCEFETGAVHSGHAGYAARVSAVGNGIHCNDVKTREISPASACNGVQAYLQSDISGLQVCPFQVEALCIALYIVANVRYEAMNMGNSNHTLSKIDLASYKKRIDIDLTNLISTLWRKIADNPPLLEFFTLFDRRCDSFSASTCIPLLC
jgi:hypothetical protein